MPWTADPFFAIIMGVDGSKYNWSVAKRLIGTDRLSVIMPVYNLAETIAGNIRNTAELYEKQELQVEIVPVDDGSTDGTGEILTSVAAKHNGKFTAIKPVLLAKNGGKGVALKAGFENSTGKYILLLDGDLDINPIRTPVFFEVMSRNNADIVIGSKRHSDSLVQYPWHRRIVSWTYFTIVRILTGLRVTDTQTGMKLFKRDILGEALGRMLVKAYAFDLELLAIAKQRGATIAEAPVEIHFGSKFGCLRPNTVKTMAIDTLAIFYRLKILKYYEKAEIPCPACGRPLVSIVIACPGDSAVLRQCLQAIANQSYRNIETLILPDRPLDIEPSLAQSIAARVIPTGKVRPAEKRNLGIAVAKGEVMAFIDDDAYPDCRWIEYALRYFGDITIGALGGPGITPADDGYMQRLGGRVYDNILVSGNYCYRYKAGGVRRDVDDYPSCNLFVRTAVLREINGYRTDFWPGEDTLLCKDIHDRGYRIVYDPWVIVHHHRRPLFRAHLRQLGRYAFHRGYFMKRFPSNSRHFSYLVPSFFVSYLAIAAVVEVALFAANAEPWAMIAVAAPLAAYLAIVLASAFAANPGTWILTAIGVAASHIVYGVRLIQGLSAKKAPCEFIGKDHAK